MSLKDTWVDRKNEVDDVDAEDINKVAHAVIDLEENSATKGEIGKIDAALDSIIAIQNALIGGDAV